MLKLEALVDLDAQAVEYQAGVTRGSTIILTY
jgi:hypothetical protein